MLQLPPEQWAEITFGCADLGDKRRTKRLVQTASELSAHTGSSLAEPCEGNLSSILSSYRFIENGAVQPEAIAEAGFQATVSASEASELILALATNILPEQSLEIWAGQKIRRPKGSGLTLSCYWMPKQRELLA